MVMIKYMKVPLTLVISAFALYASMTEVVASDGTGKDHSTAKNISADPILSLVEKLGEEADYIIEHQNNTDRADSLLREAINKAESSFNQTAILNAYIQYLGNEYLEHGAYTLQSIDKAANTLNDSGNDALSFDTYVAISKACIYMRNQESSLTYTMKLIALTSADSDLSQKCEALMLAGKALDLNGLKKDAFENFLKAEELVQQLHTEDKSSIQYDLDGALFDFYLKIHQFDKAAEHKLRQIELISGEHVDSVKLMWLKIDLCRLRLAENKEADVRSELDDIIAYSEKHHLLRIFDSALSTYRTILLNNQDLNGFKELFVNRYPENLMAMKEELPASFYIINSYIFEEEGKVDSADHYFQLAKQEVDSIGHEIYSSNFYKRFGEYFLRNARPIGTDGHI